MNVVTNYNESVKLNETTLSEFKARLRGELLFPDHEGYDEARTIFNAMIDKRPAMIARCANVGDVVASINFAREHNLLVSIRSGAHSGPGLALVNDGLVIDLSRMKGHLERVSPCLDEYNIRWICSFLSQDRRRRVCIHEASDAEALRVAYRTAKIPFDRVWSAELLSLDEKPSLT